MGGGGARGRRLRPAGWPTLAASKTGKVHAIEVCRALKVVLDKRPKATLICDGGEMGSGPRRCWHRRAG